MRLKSKTKLITTLVSFLMIGAAAISSTVAFLYTSDDAITNVFIPSQVKTEVVEDIENQPNVKEDVKIKNTGDTAAWIRAAVVVTWQDAAGNVYGQMPVAGQDYTVWTPGTNWVKGSDGFYYYTKPVPANQATPNALIESIKPIVASPADGYYLTVEILGSGIQTFQGDIDTYSEAWAKVVTNP